ncbi:hypothetical protein DFH09DRAFT_1275796 [Mycena vulgaris]|nr:hypothetical protein DFH09DRAFT_1275796 [Mycena vulgaris]
MTLFGGYRLIGDRQMGLGTNFRTCQKSYVADIVGILSLFVSAPSFTLARTGTLGHFVFLKRSDEAPPEGSDIDPDTFFLIIQTKYQRECWEKYDSRFAGIDGTHNTIIHYENMTCLPCSLGTIGAAPSAGMPAAWMVSSNGKEPTIDYFLSTILLADPSIIPSIFMSDSDYT